jgi:hypothetical protein
MVSICVLNMLGKIVIIIAEFRAEEAAKNTIMDFQYRTAG